MPVPPSVSFELGKEEMGLGIREGLQQGVASKETHGVDSVTQSFLGVAAQGDTGTPGGWGQ